jgi:hypothetical protein
LLEASILAEKALLDAKALTSVNLGLHTLEFNRHYLLVLLGRSSGKLGPETISHAREMLYLLKYLVSDSEEVYNGIVWQLVCCPFTPFLALFGQILDNKGAVRRDNVEALAAMKELPVFLEAMGRRNTLASKLHMIADVFVDHAESVVNPPPPRSKSSSFMPSMQDTNLADCASLQALTLHHIHWQPNILPGQDSPRHQSKASPVPFSMLPGTLFWIIQRIFRPCTNLTGKGLMAVIPCPQGAREMRFNGLTCSSARPTSIG